MIIDSNLLDNLTDQAKSSPRLRMNYDLRNSSDDGSQRLLNALEPGTLLPIHRHRNTSETVAVLRGSLRQNFYDETGCLTESAVVSSGDSCPFFVVPMGVWHNTESLESGTVIFEAKDGKYEPVAAEDIL